MTRLLLLDRDGVINEDSDDYIKSVEEWRLIPGSLDAIADFARCGWQIAVVTNQSGIGRGYFDQATLEAMHSKLTGLLVERDTILSGIYFCPHRPDDGCACRKPATGLLEAAAADAKLPLAEAVMIGDSLKDLEAARAAGATPVLVCTGKGRDTLDAIAGKPEWQDVAVFSDLRAAAAKLAVC